MSPFEIGLVSVIAMVAMIYMAVYIPIALGLVSFVTIWILRDSLDLPLALLKIAAMPATPIPQEWLQAGKMKLPSYRVVGTLGEAHKQTFDVECTVTDTGHSERGIGASRRAGEQAAAAAMLQHLHRARPEAAALPPNPSA